MFCSMSDRVREEEWRFVLLGWFRLVLGLGSFFWENGMSAEGPAEELEWTWYRRFGFDDF